MDLFDRTDDARLHDLDGPAESILRAALVAHLRHHFVVLGQFAQVPRLVHGLRQRLLAVHVFAHLDGSRGHEGMAMVGYRHRHGVDVLFFFFQHVAPVLVKPRVGVQAAGFFGLVLVDVADGDDFLGTAITDIAAAFAAGAHAANPEFLARTREVRTGFADSGESRSAGCRQG